MSMIYPFMVISIMGVFSSWNFLDSATVALSFLFGN